MRVSLFILGLEFAAVRVQLVELQPQLLLRFEQLLYACALLLRVCHRVLPVRLSVCHLFKQKHYLILVFTHLTK